MTDMIPSEETTAGKVAQSGGDELSVHIDGDISDEDRAKLPGVVDRLRRRLKERDMRDHCPKCGSPATVTFPPADLPITKFGCGSHVQSGQFGESAQCLRDQLAQAHERNADLARQLMEAAEEKAKAANLARELEEARSEWDRFEDLYVEARHEIGDLQRLLKLVEWYGGACVICGMDEHDGHATECPFTTLAQLPGGGGE